jgi:hypothetical protein
MFGCKQRSDQQETAFLVPANPLSYGLFCVVHHMVRGPDGPPYEEDILAMEDYSDDVTGSNQPTPIWKRAKGGFAARIGDYQAKVNTDLNKFTGRVWWTRIKGHMTTQCTFHSATKYVNKRVPQCMYPCRNWSSPTPSLPPPLSPVSVPLPPEPRGGGHTRLRLRRGGSSNSDDWRKSLALCLLYAFCQRT